MISASAGAAQAAADEDVIIQHVRENLQRPVIRLSDMLPLLEAGAGRKAIIENFPDLHPKKVFKVKSLFAAKILPRPDKDPDDVLHVLCDENVSNIHVRVCQRLFGYATSVTFERMNASPDADVWRYAREHSFDLIVTLDKRNTTEKDLTRIALNAWGQAGPAERLPQLLHLIDDARESRKFGKLAALSLEEIFELRARPLAPVMHLSRRGVRPGLPERKVRIRSRKALRRAMAAAAMAARRLQPGAPLPG